MARRVESVLELRIVRAQWPVNQWPAALRGRPTAAQQRRREESGQAAQRVGCELLSDENGQARVQVGLRLRWPAGGGAARHGRNYRTVRQVRQVRQGRQGGVGETWAESLTESIYAR